MKTAGLRAVVALSALVSPVFWSPAQASAAPQQSPNPGSNPEQSKQQPAQKPPAESNPFPGDATDVPVLPNGSQPVMREAPAPVGPPPALPGADVDPVRSPDEPLLETSSSFSSGSSSSSADLGRVLEPPPDTEEHKARKGKNLPVPEHTETAKDDESVGQYYLDRKNWRAALSRFQSALILDPENPDVYWGLAESQRHLGDTASAKANYMKVVEYDPDSKHGKEAKRLLKDPEMANAHAVPASHP
jgi:tetratricopeptide (TPR) repeat protein